MAGCTDEATPGDCYYFAYLDQFGDESAPGCAAAVDDIANVPYHPCSQSHAALASAQEAVVLAVVADIQHAPASVRYSSYPDAAYVAGRVGHPADTAEAALGCLLVELVAVAGIAGNPNAKLAAAGLGSAASFVADKARYQNSGPAYAVAVAGTVVPARSDPEVAAGETAADPAVPASFLAHAGRTGPEEVLPAAGERAAVLWEAVVAYDAAAAAAAAADLATFLVAVGIALASEPVRSAVSVRSAASERFLASVQRVCLVAFLLCAPDH